MVYLMDRTVTCLKVFFSSKAAPTKLNFDASKDINRNMIQIEHSFRGRVKLPCVNSRQISPKVSLMLQMLDLVSLACLAG